MIRLPDLTEFTYQFPIINQTKTAPTEVETTGQSWIVASIATGVWTGKEKNIAIALQNNPTTESHWEFVVPTEGMMLWDLNTNAFYYYNDSSIWTVFETAAGISNIVEDTSPQLGGDLDLNNKAIYNNNESSKTLVIDLTGATGSTSTTLDFNQTTSTVITFPTITDTLVGKTTTDTLTHKRLTTPKLNEDVQISATSTEVNILDGATLTTAELNILDGSATTQATISLVGTDGVVISDADIIKQALVSDFGTYVAKDTQTLTNKTFNVEGTGNSISNIDVDDFKANVIDTDTSLTEDSDDRIATQKATKAYVDGILGANDAMTYKGVIACAGDPNYPAADAGDTYKVSTAGNIGGASGPEVEVGDMIICTTDSTSSGNHATVGIHWTIIQVNIDGAVTGPASSTGDNVIIFNGTSGKVIKDSGLTIGNIFDKSTDDTDDISIGDAKFVTASDITNLGNLSNTNSGDQTTIVGITGTKAEFNTAVSDGTILYVGDVTSNVSTSLTIGTRTGTTVPINSDGSSPDITLAEADTTYAGLLGADKWDEIVANTTHKSSDGTDHTYIGQDVRSTASPTFVAVTADVTGDLTGTADQADSITVTANNTANETVYLTFVDGATGKQGIETDTGLYYNPSTGDIDTLGITTGTLGLQVGASGTRFTQIHYDSDLKAVIFTQ